MVVLQELSHIHCILTNASSYSEKDTPPCKDEGSSVHILTILGGENENSTHEVSSLQSSISPALNLSPIFITRPVNLFLICKLNDECMCWEMEEVTIESNARNVEVYAQISKDEKEEYWSTVRGNPTMDDDDDDGKSSSNQLEFFTTTLVPISFSSTNSSHRNSTIVYCVHLKLLSLRPSNEARCFIKKLQVQWRKTINTTEEIPSVNLESNFIIPQEDTSIKMDTATGIDTVVSPPHNTHLAKTIQSMFEIQIQNNAIMKQLTQQIKTMQLSMMTSQQELHNRLDRIENHWFPRIQSALLSTNVASNQQEIDQKDKSKDDESCGLNNNDKDGSSYTHDSLDDGVKHQTDAMDS